MNGIMERMTKGNRQTQLLKRKRDKDVRGFKPNNETANDQKADDKNEQKQMNGLKQKKIYKRLKRLGVWLLSFVSSFLCGACLVCVLW